MALSFVFAGSYDPKDACKHICWLLKTKRKFYRGTQSHSWRPLKSIFWRSQKWSEPLLPLGGVWKLKNYRHLTFGIVESVRVDVWHFRLFLRIAMILRMLANTYVGYWRLKENFLKREVTVVFEFSYPSQRQKWLRPFLGPSKNGFQWTSCLTLSAVREFSFSLQ